MVITTRKTIDVEAFRVSPADSVTLGDLSTRVKSFYKSKNHCKKLLEEHVELLAELRRPHYASNRYGLAAGFSLRG